MLSKLSQLVMGILWNKPMNPYELTKLVDMSVIQDWFPLTAPSIYTTIKNLQKKRLITGETLYEGKIPPKTVYTLTDKGEEELLSELLEGLESYAPEASEFGIALFHIGMLKQDDALKYTKQRLEKLEDLYTKANKRLEDCAPKIPFNLRMMLTLNVYRLSAEIKMTRELITEIEDAKDWDSSIVMLQY
jgi:DNA-binding PadR family transcriptional regulator